jgi:hypothetical protein
VSSTQRPVPPVSKTGDVPGLGCGSEVEGLPSMCEALGSTPRTTGEKMSAENVLLPILTHSPTHMCAVETNSGVWSGRRC